MGVQRSEVIVQVLDQKFNRDGRDFILDLSRLKQSFSRLNGF